MIKTILFIDDDLDWTELITIAFKREPRIKLITAATLKEGLRDLEDLGIGCNLVLTDWNLDRPKGITSAPLIREALSHHIPVIIQSLDESEPIRFITSIKEASEEPINLTFILKRSYSTLLEQTRQTLFTESPFRTPESF